MECFLYIVGATILGKSQWPKSDQEILESGTITPIYQMN